MLIDGVSLKYPVVCVIDGFNKPVAYTKDGHNPEQPDGSLDLVMASDFFGFEINEPCVLLSANGQLLEATFGKCVEDYAKQGNLFKNIDGAKSERNYRWAKRRLNAKMRLLEGKHKNNWESEAQRKHYFCYNHLYKSIDREVSCISQGLSSWRYSNKETIDWVIANMAQDIKTILEVEDETV